MKNWRLRTKLIFAYAGLILIGFTGFALLAGGQISSGTVQDFQNNLLTQTNLAARALNEPLEESFSADLIIKIVADYAAQMGARLTLVDRSGQAWLDSSGDLPPNLSGSPEFAAAINGRSSSAVRPNEAGESTVYAASPITHEGRVMAVLHASAPLAAARQVVNPRWAALFTGVIIIAGLAILAGLWLSISLTRPLAAMRATALRVANGDFSQRLPEDRSDELGELAVAFNHMAAQVESMIAEQRAFAGNASHELRTPLTAIRLRSEALRAGDLDPQTTEQYIAEIDDEVARLGRLTQDLMLLSRLEAGRAQRGQEQIEPLKMARQLLREFEKPASEAGVSLTLKTAESLPVITAGLSHLQIVFRNLLSNALKFTPPGGGITWELTTANGALRSTITDNGQGIAPEDLPHLFDRFYRVDKARTRQIEGVGLGLSLVKTIIDLYGGDITITSPGIGQGTMVFVEWPQK